MKSLHSFGSSWRRKSISCCRWSAFCHGIMCDPGLKKKKKKRYKGYKLLLKRKNSSPQSIKPKIKKKLVKMKDKYRPWVPTVLTMYSVSWRIYNKWAVEPPHGDSYILTNLTDSLFSGEKNIIVEIFHKKTVTVTIKNSNFNFKVFIEHIANIVCHARCHVRSHDRCLCLTRRRTLCTGRIWKFPLISSWVLIGSYSYSFLLIGRCDYFGLVSRHSIKKRSITGMVSDHTALY